MKIKLDFVTNSSSISYFGYGVKISTISMVTYKFWTYLTILGKVTLEFPTFKTFENCKYDGYAFFDLPVTTIIDDLFHELNICGQLNHSKEEVFLGVCMANMDIKQTKEKALNNLEYSLSLLGIKGKIKWVSETSYDILCLGDTSNVIEEY